MDTNGFNDTTNGGEVLIISPTVNGHSEKKVNNGTPADAVVGFTNVKQDDAQQYLNNYKAHRTGISHEEMVKVYTEWANNYDEVG